MRKVSVSVAVPIDVLDRVDCLRINRSQAATRGLIETIGELEKEAGSTSAKIEPPTVTRSNGEQDHVTA